MSRPFCHRRLPPRQQRVQPRGVKYSRSWQPWGQVGRVTPCAPARRSRRRWLAIAAGRGLPTLPTNWPRLSLTRKPKLAASERKEPKADGLIRNGEWRQVFSAEMIPPLRSLRCLRSFVAIQFRSSSLTAIFQPSLANKRDGALGSSPHRPAAVFAR
jgi:hypothetical protein